jgi:hypothetical protein
MARLSAVLVVVLGMMAFVLPRGDATLHRVDLEGTKLDIPPHYVLFDPPWMAFLSGVTSSRGKAVLSIPVDEMADHGVNPAAVGLSLRVELLPASALATKNAPSDAIPRCSTLNPYQPMTPPKDADCESRMEIDGVAVSFTVRQSQLRLVPAIQQFLTGKIARVRKAK